MDGGIQKTPKVLRWVNRSQFRYVMSHTGFMDGL
jgi:hypothetical protein